MKRILAVLSVIGDWVAPIGSHSKLLSPNALVGLLLLVPLCMSTLATASGLHVKGDATGVADGTSWANAYTNLQTALSAAGSGTQIWVAAGTYVPGSQRENSFVVRSGVELYGGFAGTETDLDERLWQANVTILSGDINRDDTAVGGRSENVYQVVIGSNGALLDGFTISGGNANSGSTSRSRGGGMYNDFASVTVRNCTFDGNTAGMDGGAIYVAGIPSVTATTVLENCRFANNGSGSNGGAIYLIYSSSFIRDCLFTNNFSSNNGGAMYCLRSSLDMTSCVFETNRTAYGGFGGGAHLSYASSRVDRCSFINNGSSTGGGIAEESNSFTNGCTLTSCIFVGNTAKNQGGGIYSWDGQFAATDCVFAGNRTLDGTSTGGGMHRENALWGSTWLKDCVFTANSTDPRWGYGGGLSIPASSESTNHTTIVERCVFSGNLSVYGGGTYVQGAYRPKFRSCVFAGNRSERAGTGQGAGAYFNDSDALIQNCTITRNASLNNGGGLQRSGYKTIRVDNCILWGNKAPIGSELYNWTNGELIISHCDIRGGANTTKGVITDGGDNFESQPFPDGVYASTWTGPAEYDASCYQSYLSDATAAWSPGALNGMFVQVDTNSTLQHFIVSNTVDTLTVWGDFSGQGLEGNAYTIHDYRLPQYSVCIDRGTNIIDITKDVELILRPLDGDGSASAEWDVGAYEYVSSTSDTDADGMTDRNEVDANTDPTDSSSWLGFTRLVPATASVLIEWQGGATAVQVLEHTTNICTRPIEWIPIFTNNPPMSALQNFKHHGPASTGPNYYRLVCPR